MSNTYHMWIHRLAAFLSVLSLLLVPGAWSLVYLRKNAWVDADLSAAQVAAAIAGLLLASWIGLRSMERRDSWREAAFTACLINSCALAWLLWSGVEVVRYAPVVSFAAAFSIFLAPIVVRGLDRTRLLLLAIMTAALIGMQTPVALDILARPKLAAAKESLDTSLYGLELRRYRNHVPLPFAMGGGFALLPDEELLLVTGDGVFYLLREDRHELSLSTIELPLRVPINNAPFRELAETISVFAPNFRVADLLLTRSDDVATIRVSHHYFHEEERCVTMRISQLTTTLSELRTVSGDDGWTTVYETSPCMTVKSSFKGHQCGGRLVMVDEKTLLFSVGDHSFDLVNSEVDFPQDMTVDYGKILAIDLPTGTASIWSSGHRNPQGLLVTTEGDIWSTEHGPRGGDELNFIEKDANYGWPIVVYGTTYETHSWPRNPTQGRHDGGFHQPTYVWTPSVGISNLIQPTHENFELWRDDLIVSSMTGQSLFRIRLVDEKPVLVEPIPLPFGVRDLVETASGEMALWSKNGSTIGFISPRNAEADGAELFLTCTGCHPAGPGEEHGIGPRLNGIFGRRIGAAEGFSYSRALADSKGRWTEEALDAFLAEPATFLPGTSMEYVGIADENVRQQLIEYLKTL